MATKKIAGKSKSKAVQRAKQLMRKHTIKPRKINTVADVREFVAGVVATDDVKITLSDTEVNLVYKGRGYTWSRSTGELIGESNTPTDETVETTEQSSEVGTDAYTEHKEDE